MKIRITALAASLLCLVISCNKETKEQASKAEAPISDMSNKQDAGYGINNTDSTTQTPPQVSDKKKQPSPSDPVPNPDWDKKIIKTAFLNFEVKDYKAYYSAFREKVRNLGGYVAQEEQAQSDYKIENTLVVKVPVDQFDNALAQLTTGSEKINERKVTSQDVTSEFVDTKSRIEAKKQVRQRYMDLLNQAKNMEEILNVQSEINGIQEEIESATGRVEYLGHSSAYSTINITYYQVLNSSAKDSEDKSPNFGTQLGDAFKTGWSWIVDLFVGIVSVWPLILLGFVAFVWYKRSRLLRSKQA
ncbi:MAG TPA: DUF4349 domain-containing protein [Chitinophagaceae bacterium]|nr:DUF4349 domain-containing protein [Chitinophagaceae bacterium]